MDLESLPLLDHHCHALRRPAAPLDADAFRSHFSESTDPAMRPHLAFSLFYQHSLRDLAAILERAPAEEAILTARHQLPLPLYANHLFQAANLSTLLVDTGFRGKENYSLDEMRLFVGCPVFEVLRLETLMEQMVLDQQSFPALEEA